MKDDPSGRECLRCYLIRELEAHGCDNTRTWTLRWRAVRAPDARDLLERLADRGGCCCDCEMIFNVWRETGDEPATRCHGSDHPDPLVPCTAWSPVPESLVTDPGEPEDEFDIYQDAYW